MKRRYHLHLPGLVYCSLLVLISIAAMNAQNNLLFWAFGAMFSALILSGMVSGMMMLGVRVRRLDPPPAHVGDPLLIRYRLRNRNRLTPIFNVHIDEQPVAERSGEGRAWQRLTRFAHRASAWVMHAGPRETVHGEAVFWPTSRGRARFGEVRIWTTFPFGIIKKSVTFNQPQDVLIGPRLYALRPDVLAALTPPARLGMRSAGGPGLGDDFYGLREYRDNDSVRNIAWKRSAALGRLVCVERSRPNPPRLRIILNLADGRSERDSASGGRDEQAGRLEEDAISLAASLARAAHHHGFEVGLSVLGFPGRPIPIRRSHWHLSRLMAALAEIDLDSPRLPPPRPTDADTHRAGLVVVHPDRIEPGIVRGDAQHLTGRQLAALAAAPLGWDPRAQSEKPAADSAGPAPAGRNGAKRRAEVAA